MKTPIKVNENGDINYFNSIEEVEMYLEPIDIENNEYIITDADNKLITPIIVIEKRPVIFRLFNINIKKIKLQENK